MRAVYEDYCALLILTGSTGANGGTDTIYRSSLSVTPGMWHHVTTVFIATVGTSSESRVTGVTAFIGAAYIRCGGPSVTVCLIGNRDTAIGTGTGPAVLSSVYRGPVRCVSPGMACGTPLNVAAVRALILPLALSVTQVLIRLTVGDDSQALLGKTICASGDRFIVLSYRSVLVAHPFCCTTLRADILLLRIRTTEVAVVVSRIPIVILSLPVIGVTGVAMRQPIMLGFIPGDWLPLVLPRIERMISCGSLSLGFLGAGARAIAGRGSRSLMLGFGNLPPPSPSGGVVMSMAWHIRAAIGTSPIQAIYVCDR